MGIRKLKQFPPLEAIKQLDNVINAQNATMTGFLTVPSKNDYHPEITAPFTLFSNKKGFARYQIDGKPFVIEDDTILIINRGQQYDLLIENPDETVIQNVHFNETLLRGAYNTFVHSSEDILDHKTPENLLEFSTGISLKSKHLQKLFDATESMKHMEEDRDDSILLQILDCLFWQNEKARKAASNIPSIKRSVRNELFHRISNAKDYLWSNYKSELNIDDLCLEIGMSKFHFMRVFKSCFNTSPYQYLKQIRHQKAKSLLLRTTLHIQEIATELNFEQTSSFSKSFRKLEGVSPEHFRQQGF